MSHITSFEIDGLNGRSVPIKLDLNRHTNVLFGSNGSGKTSILRILDSAMSGDARKIKNICFKKATVSIYSILFKKEFVLTFEKKATTRTNSSKRLSTLGPVDSRFLGFVTEENWTISPEPDDSEKISRNWQHIFLPTSRFYERSIWVSNAADDRIDDDRLELNLADSVQRIWQDRYATTRRIVSEIQEAGLQNILFEVLAPSKPTERKSSSAEKSIDAKKAFDRMSSFLARQSGSKAKFPISRDEFVKQFSENSSVRKIITKVDEVESRIETELQDINKLSNLIRRLFSEGKKVSFEGPKIRIVANDGNPINFENLSSGEKQLIAILLVSINAEESTFIVDEPELSMHIDWQQTLIENIHSLNHKCQLIFATHSPEIMANIKDTEIFKI